MILVSVAVTTGFVGSWYIDKTKNNWFRMPLRLGNLMIHMITICIVFWEVKHSVNAFGVAVLCYCLSSIVTELLVCRKGWMYYQIVNRKKG